MNWTDRYIEIPFVFDGRDFNGCDCWGLVCLVYLHELGIDLPAYYQTLTDRSLGSLRRAAKTAAIESQRWTLVKDQPQEFDVILLRRGNISCHIGVVCAKNKMLHIEEGIRAVTERYTNLLWQHRITGFFHYDR